MHTLVAIVKLCQLVILTQEMRWRARAAWSETLTLDIEGGVGGVERIPSGRVVGDALEVARVQQPIHSCELEVAALLEAPLAAFQGLAVVKPAVVDVDWVADLAAEHGAAAVQSVLGFGLLGELDGGSLDGQNWERAMAENEQTLSGRG